MVFISYRTLSFLTEYEREVLRMTVEPSQPLSLEEIAIKLCLTRERIRQIYDNASKRIRASEAIKQLFQHEDCSVYGIKEDTPFVFSRNLHTDRLIEERDFLIEYLQNNREADWHAPNITENSLYFILLMKGMIPLWIDQEKKELSTHYIAPGQAEPILFVNDILNQYKFNKAIREAKRLQKIKKTEDVLIPIVSYFIDNDYYWGRNSKPEIVEREKLKALLIDLFRNVCNISMEDDNLLFKKNKVDYGEILYSLLRNSDIRLHREELYRQLQIYCKENELLFDFTDSLQIATLLSKDSRIVPVGKSSYWGLKEWGENVGSIREIAIQKVKQSEQPIHIIELAKLVIKERPDSNANSVTSIIRQTAATGELLLFYDDYIGYPKKEYGANYILMPQSFDDWMQAFMEYVVTHNHYPCSQQNGYEGYLYRWHYKASKLIDLSADEILKFDLLEKELAYYPHNAIENHFLQNCNLYKKFVENNKRMLTKNDAPELFSWYYAANRNYSKYNDNRNKYFRQLLQYISKILN